MPTFLFAGNGNPSGGGNSIRFDVAATGHDSVVLTVSHDGEVYTKTFKAGKPVVFSLSDLPSDAVIDGAYRYDLRVVPSLPPGLDKKLAAARASGDDKAASKILRDAGVTIPETLTGSFLASGGSIVNPNATEDPNSAKSG